MILVDTSVWMDHLRGQETALAEALDAGRVLAHPFVTGELACGHLGRRADFLSLLAALPATVVATHTETSPNARRWRGRRRREVP